MCSPRQTPVASPPFEISTLFPPFQPSDDPCLIRALTTTKGDEGETQHHHHHHIRPPSFALSACISVALSRFRTLENRFTGDLDSDTELIQIAISSVWDFIFFELTGWKIVVWNQTADLDLCCAVWYRYEYRFLEGFMLLEILFFFLFGGD